MNRFFSKLDLRDIKIDPRSTSFPPDAEEEVEVSTTDPASAAVDSSDPAPSLAAASEVEQDVEAEVSEPVAAPGWFNRQPHVPTWTSQPATSVVAPPQATTNGTTESIGERSIDDNVVEDGPEGGAGFVRAIENGVVHGEEDLVEVLKVSARSRPSAVAGAIAGVVREAGRAEVQAIGAGATNQAVKAVAIARDYLRETGIEAVCLPAFIDVTIENEDRTAIRLVVEPR